MSTDLQRDDPSRLVLTFKVALAGIVAMLVAFVVAVFAFRSKSQPGEVIAAVLGSFGTVVGTLAGYVAGQTAGAAGRAAAQERADTAQERLQYVLAKSQDPDILEQLRDLRPDLFGGSREATGEAPR